MERPRVDLEQQVAFLHQAAFIEGYAVNETGHAWADIDRFRRLQSAGELVPLIDRLFDNFGHAYFGCGHLLCTFRRFTAGAQYQHCGKGEGKMPEVLIGLFHVYFRQRV